VQVVVEHPLRDDLEAGGGERNALRNSRTENASKSGSAFSLTVKLLSVSAPPGGSQSSGFGEPRPGPNDAPNVQGTRSPQWSRWKWVMAIASTRGQPSRFRRLEKTPGPQSRSSLCVPSIR
jgi:hypothetical protein